MRFARWPVWTMLALAVVTTGCATGRMSEQTSRPERRGLFAMLGEGRAPSSAYREAQEAEAEAINRGHARPPFQLSWPLAQLAVTSPFGNRNRDFHEGVDFRASRGTAVFAAHGGRVVYSGSQIRGYGRMVVIKGAQGVSTVYAHNSRLLVKKGARVKEGQKIALSGNTGRSSGPHLHFEVRQGTQALDPMAWLSGRRKPARAPVRMAKPSGSRSLQARRDQLR